MTDCSTVSEEFEQAVGIRKELNQVHWKDFNRLAIVFASVFKVPEKDLKLLSDMNYYRGGYPAEESPARLDALFWKAGTVARYWHELGRLDEVNQALSFYGMEIRPVEGYTWLEATDEDLGSTRKVTKAHDRALQMGFRLGATVRDTLQWFLDATHGLQGTICSMADEIKINLFEQVNEKLDGAIDKGGFATAVNLVAKKRHQEETRKDVNPTVAKALEKSEVLGNNGEFLREKVTEGAT
jgi:hypothetical protein